jgi:hypothetical protein
LLLLFGGGFVNHGTLIIGEVSFHEGMVVDLCKGGSFSRVFIEDESNKILVLFGGAGGEANVEVLNVGEDLNNGGSLEW